MKGTTSTSRILCVFPSDTLTSSRRKGEVKERYFNPSNLFTGIHVISLTPHDGRPESLQRMFGNASVSVHSLGPRSLPGRLLCRLAPELYYYARLKKFLGLVRRIRPSVIRAYNPLVQGFLATSVGKRLGIPTVVSVHGNYDYDERLMIPKRILFWARKKPAKTLYDILTLLRLETFDKGFERYSLKSASEVICAYQFPRQYVKKHRNTKISVIYNRVDTNRFRPQKTTRKHEITIIHVGRLDFEKNPENLIRAIADLRVKLLVVGNGELNEYLKDIVDCLQIDRKVQFVYHFDHKEIHRLYAKADIFVMCMKYGGVSIPILEAMASGLPIVFTRGLYETRKEVIDGIGLGVKDDPNEIRGALLQLINDRRLRKRLGRRAREKIALMNGEKMEHLETALYKQLIGQ